MKITFEISVDLPVQPSIVYNAWLDSNSHTEMTGAKAECSNSVGEVFSAWDGYISGENVEMVKDNRIIQKWRTTDFLDEDEDSLIIVSFEKRGEGCCLIIEHNDIPLGQPDYKDGWREFYFKPMTDYFNKKS